MNITEQKKVIIRFCGTGDIKRCIKRLTEHKYFSQLEANRLYRLEQQELYSAEYHLLINLIYKAIQKVTIEEKCDYIKYAIESLSCKTIRTWIQLVESLLNENKITQKEFNKLNELYESWKNSNYNKNKWILFVNIIYGKICHL
jgi:hypothetical protein